jgi:hypothetical protein
VEQLMNTPLAGVLPAKGGGQMKPEARHEKLLSQEVGGELVVYDQQQNRAHLLNRSAAFVWHHCDGRTSVAEMAVLLQQELKLPTADEEMVWLALDQLEKARLLRDRLKQSTDAVQVTRRVMMKKTALAGGLIALLPVIYSIAAPTPVMAASVLCATISCNSNITCTSQGCAGCNFVTNKCVDSIPA